MHFLMHIAYMKQWELLLTVCRGITVENKQSKEGMMEGSGKTTETDFSRKIQNARGSSYSLKS